MAHGTNNKTHLNLQLNVEPGIPPLPNGNADRHGQQSDLCAGSAQESYKLPGESASSN